MSQYKFRFSKEELIELVLRNPETSSYFTLPAENTTENTTEILRTQFIFENIMIIVSSHNDFVFENIIYEKVGITWVKRLYSLPVLGLQCLYFFKENKDRELFYIQQQHRDSLIKFKQKVCDHKTQILNIGMDQQILTLYFPFLLSQPVKNARKNVSQNE